MPKDFLPKEQKSPHASKPTASLEDIPAFDDLKELDEDAFLTTERQLIGGLGIEENKAGLPQANLSSVLVQEKDMYVVSMVFLDTPSDSAAFSTGWFTCHYPSEVMSISEVHTVAAGGTSTMLVEVVNSGSAEGTGTNLLTTDFNLNSAADTPVIKDKADLVQANTLITRGQRIGLALSTGTLGNIEGVCVTIYLQYRGRGEYNNAK